MESRHIHRSLLRTQQFLGCDRELAMTLLLVCICMAVMSSDLKVAAAAGLLLLSGLFLLHRICAHDPQIRKIYLRSLRYRRFYQASGRLDQANFKAFRSSAAPGRRI